MDRRCFLGGLSALPAASVVVAETNVLTAALAQLNPERSSGAIAGTTRIPLVPSGPVSSRTPADIIENLDIDARFGNGITVLHPHVTVRNCRIRHAGGHGVQAMDADGLVLQDLEIDHVGAPPSGVGPSHDCNNVHLDNCPNSSITRVMASRGSSNVYAKDSARTHISFLELHDARGPTPRGQNVQFNASPDSILEDFAAENGPTSWTEDNISVFRSDRCTIRRGLVSYNNSPTGDGVMIEGSFDCTVEDVDAVEQGNGAFAAVPQGDAGSGGCRFLRCRTRQTYNASRDGRPAPTSRGLSIYVRISTGARRHTVSDCHFDALANPKNLIWDTRALNGGWSFTARAFRPRTPIRLKFGW